MNKHELIRIALGEQSDDARRWAFLKIFAAEATESSNKTIGLIERIGAQSQCLLPSDAVSSLVELAFPAKHLAPASAPETAPIAVSLPICFATAPDALIGDEQSANVELQPSEIANIAHSGLTPSQIVRFARMLEEDCGARLTLLAQLPTYDEQCPLQAETDLGCIYGAIDTEKRCSEFQKFWQFCSPGQLDKPPPAAAHDSNPVDHAFDSWFKRASTESLLSAVFSRMRLIVPAQSRMADPDTAVSILLDDPPPCDTRRLRQFVDALHYLDRAVQRILPRKHVRRLATLVDRAKQLPAVRRDLVCVCLEACLSRRPGRELGIASRLKAILDTVGPRKADFSSPILSAIGELMSK